MKAMFTTRPSARGTESGPSKAENLIRNMRPTAPADTKAEPAKYSFDPTEYLYKNLSEADADKLRTQQAAAHTLLVQHTTSAYDAGKTLLRASHIVNQYVSLAAGILVCLSSAEAFVEIIFGGIGLWFIGGLTQFYLFCFGLTIIVLEVSLSAPAFSQPLPSQPLPSQPLPSQPLPSQPLPRALLSRANPGVSPSPRGAHPPGLLWIRFHGEVQC
ncbi:hypothetical protein T492DRAFT_317018 [Pavlovales sp. CCMP2436]|nr:hypothetical protein T492DRAFT_317018 [Pavlovales sp. CCMP2436]